MTLERKGTAQRPRPAMPRLVSSTPCSWLESISQPSCRERHGESQGSGPILLVYHRFSSLGRQTNRLVTGVHPAQRSPAVRKQSVSARRSLSRVGGASPQALAGGQVTLAHARGLGPAISATRCAAAISSASASANSSRNGFSHRWPWRVSSSALTILQRDPAFASRSNASGNPDGVSLIPWAAVPPPRRPSRGRWCRGAQRRHSAAHPAGDTFAYPRSPRWAGLLCPASAGKCQTHP